MSNRQSKLINELLAQREQEIALRAEIERWKAAVWA